MVLLRKESIVLSWRSDRLVSCFPYLWIQQATIRQPLSWRHLLSSLLPAFTCLSEKTGCTSANSSGKNSVFPLVFALGFHYLCQCRKEKNITVQKLNLPEYSFEVKNKEKDPYIFDPARKKYVRLTPEEWVRQNFMRYLCQEKGYPLSRMAVEKRLKSPLGLVRRADIVVYDRHTRPDIIVECKAPSVPVTQETMDQVMRYNGVLGARILCLTNGLRHVYALPYPEGKGFVYLRELPDYRDDAQG